MTFLFITPLQNPLFAFFFLYLLYIYGTALENEWGSFPFTLFYLLGDVRSRAKQGATNTAFQETASRIRLQGYDDVAEVEEGRDPHTGLVTARVAAAAVRRSSRKRVEKPPGTSAAYGSSCAM